MLQLVTVVTVVTVVTLPQRSRALVTAERCKVHEKDPRIQPASTPVTTLAAKTRRRWRQQHPAMLQLVACQARCVKLAELRVGGAGVCSLQAALDACCCFFRRLS